MYFFISLLFVVCSSKWNSRVSNSKVDFKLDFAVSNLKFNLTFYEVKLVTQRKNFYQKIWVSNSKCDVSFVTRFRTSRILNLFIFLFNYLFLVVTEAVLANFENDNITYATNRYVVILLKGLEDTFLRNETVIILMTNLFHYL